MKKIKKYIIIIVFKPNLKTSQCKNKDIYYYIFKTYFIIIFLKLNLESTHNKT
jgi:hypothetical protein